MRIAMLAPISWRVPPRHYGPWELFASLLTEALVARGHDVTLFATGDSRTAARLVSVVGSGWSEDSTIDPKVAECLHISAVFERAGDFDVIHNGFDFLPLTYSHLVATPVVTTIHGFSSPAVVAVYAKYDTRVSYVAISDADRHAALTYAATIHHGIDTSAFAPGSGDGGYVAYFGRIHPDKGTAVAIEAAALAGVPLRIAGIVHDQDYFDSKVAPHIDGDRVQFLGPVAAADRSAFLGGACALLHLIDFEEPFGYSVVEAMACGTPVIAFDRGSMRELIVQGDGEGATRTGHLVAGTKAAASAIHEATTFDRRAIRDLTVQRFGVDRMADQYVEVYEKAIAGASR